MLNGGTALLDSMLGWKIRREGLVTVGRGTKLAWRRLNHVRGNRLSIGEHSIIQANIRFEDSGGRMRIGDRTFIGKSDLVCYRSLNIGNDVIMSWGVTITDHDSHNVDWQYRRNDVLQWGAGRKDWTHVPHAPVVIADKVWIGFNASILKGVTIGEGAVVGASSVVTRDVAPFSVVAGSPARLIRKLAVG